MVRPKEKGEFIMRRHEHFTLWRLLCEHEDGSLTEPRVKYSSEEKCFFLECAKCDNYIIMLTHSHNFDKLKSIPHQVVSRFKDVEEA